jgi:predicted nucleic acid-binding protein
VIDAPAFNTAVASLQAEIVHDPEFQLLAISEDHVFASIEVMHRHNLNSTDAILLSVLLDIAAFPDAPDIVVVTSDNRLERAATVEGFTVWNPEAMTILEAHVAIADSES